MERNNSKSGDHDADTAHRTGSGFGDGDLNVAAQVVEETQKPIRGESV